MKKFILSLMVMFAFLVTSDLSAQTLVNKVVAIDRLEAQIELITEDPSLGLQSSQPVTLTGVESVGLNKELVYGRVDFHQLVKSLLESNAQSTTLSAIQMASDQFRVERNFTGTGTTLLTDDVIDLLSI